MTITQRLQAIMLSKEELERRDVLLSEQREDAEQSQEQRARGRDDAERVAGDVGILTPDGAAATLSEELFDDLDVTPRPTEASAKGEPEAPSGTHASVLCSLDRTLLMGSRAVLRALLQAPLRDAKQLQLRQDALRAPSASEVAWAHGAALPELARLEPDALWLLRHRDGPDPAVKALYDLPYFTARPLRALNRVPVALSASNMHRIYVSPLAGLLTPVLYVLVPYLVLRLGKGIRVGFREYARVLFKSFRSSLLEPGRTGWTRCVSAVFSLVFYFQGLFTSVEVSRTLRHVCTALSARTRRAARFFELARELEARMNAKDVLPAWFTGAAAPSARPLPGCSGERPAAGKPSRDLLLRDLGRDLSAASEFDAEAGLAALRRAYALDALVAVRVAKDAICGCWAEFVEGQNGGGGQKAPLLHLRGVRHPCLPTGRAVPNDWTLGAAGDEVASARHAVLTGPNAGGKSTLLKSVLLSALLAQTLTIAPCDIGCRLTPFAYISSHINVPDRHGRESLFEAEMRRAKRNLDALEALSASGGGGAALVVMDEVFSSTNPVEGIAGAFAVSRRLAAHPGAIAVVSTHFPYLCRLPRETAGAFSNYCMPVAEGTQRAAYKLQPGVSRQYVALELLRRSGFDERLVEDALAVKRALLGKSAAPGPPPATKAPPPASRLPERQKRNP